MNKVGYMLIDLSEKQQETISGGHHDEVDGMYDVNNSDVLTTSAKAKEKIQGYSAKIQAFQASLLQLAEALTDT